ncbi:neuromedin-U receptor 1-like [Salarias fasciatus]|uniref:neuromedin-U receptor 1-like n=1 Tax=Salarias fasciatus TaxID=181472 RepID=UPI001176EE6E|nr:neuromedin-U receptor 1-like [Salarias fasciatus]
MDVLLPLLNCSPAAVLAGGSGVFGAAGCPEVAVACGMNVSWVLADATGRDLAELCLSEDDYLSGELGVPRSPVFLPVCVAYLAVFLVGVLGNSLTCAVILCYKVMQTPTNYYLLSLAASDLLVLLLGMPLELYDLWRNYPFLLGEGGCYFKTFLFETVCFASILNVTALSVERYVAVVHPLRVKRMATRAHVKRVILLLWALSMLCAVPNTSIHGIGQLPPKFGRHFPRSAMCYIQQPRIYNWVILVSTLVFFLLPMLVISVLYLLIGLRLRRERLEASADAGCFGPEGVSGSNRRRLSRRNVQITKMLCVLVVVFGLCWAPFHVDRLMWSYMDTSSPRHQAVFEQVHIISGVCFYLSSAVNPVLYNLMSTRFRETFSHITCHSIWWSAHSGSHRTQRSTLSQNPSVRN